MPHQSIELDTLDHVSNPLPHQSINLDTLDHTSNSLSHQYIDLDTHQTSNPSKTKYPLPNQKLHHCSKVPNTMQLSKVCCIKYIVVFANI